VTLVTPRHLRGRVLSECYESIPDPKEKKTASKIVKQLKPEHVRDGALIARHRVHVERHNARIKAFRILRKIPLTLIQSVNKIFYICCYLTMFAPPLVEQCVLPENWGDKSFAADSTEICTDFSAISNDNEFMDCNADLRVSYELDGGDEYEIM
jgi:hypothetical protein